MDLLPENIILFLEQLLISLPGNHFVHVSLPVSKLLILEPQHTIKFCHVRTKLAVGFFKTFVVIRAVSKTDNFEILPIHVLFESVDFALEISPPLSFDLEVSSVVDAAGVR